MLRLGTLFSGGLGAPEQALKQMGWEHENVFACEWDKFARINYEANHYVTEGHFHKDINDMDGKPYKGKVDIIIGGSPCQDFSIAGLRAGVDGHRGQLIWQYFRIIDEVRPPVFIYENVKGMTSDKGGKTLKDFLDVFRSIGYHCHSEVLNTKDYGVPQNRERIYIVGFLNHDHYMRFEFAPKMKLKKRLKDVLEDEVDDKYYLSNRMVAYLERKKRAIKPFDGTQEYSPCVLASYHKTPTDGFYIKVPHGRIRKLTPIECARLQGADDSFNIIVSDTQSYKQSGNGMSVNVLEMLFRQIYKAKTGEQTNTLLYFIN